MDELRFVDACTEEHFKAMSLIHALGWRDTYAEAVPADYMAREITDDRWVEVFRQNYESQNAGSPIFGRTTGPGAVMACCSTGGTCRCPA